MVRLSTGTGFAPYACRVAVAVAAEFNSSIPDEKAGLPVSLKS